MRILLCIAEWVFWLLALLVLTPPACCQWAIGKSVGKSTVFGQFLTDLWHFGRRGSRRMPS